MSRVEISKATTFVAIGAPSDAVSVSKVVAYVLLAPGEPTVGETSRQAHVYAQKITRG